MKLNNYYKEEVACIKDGNGPSYPKGFRILRQDVVYIRHAKITVQITNTAHEVLITVF